MSPRILAFLIAASLLLIGPAPTSADVATVGCGRDNTLFEDADGDTSSGAGNSLYAGRNSQGRIRRALLWFDVAGQVPDGARIDSVVLTLFVASAPDTVAHAFSLHRVTRDWGEGASVAGGGSGAPAQAGDATWLHALYPAVFWSQPGGDFAPDPGAIRLVGEVGAWTWSGDGLVADVEAWLATPSSNFGWLLRGDEIAERSVRRFDAREAAEAARRPTLTLHYAGPLAATPLSWGRLKASYR